MLFVIPMTPCNEPNGALVWFDQMISNCLRQAREAKANGKPIVGIMCEFTPREIIMAAGGVPVCLCGGNAATIPTAEEHLPANLCPLIKSTYGYHVQRSNPFLEMADLVVAETTCDGKKKMFELMGETRPMYVLELPQKAEEADDLAFWKNELVKFGRQLEARFGTVLSSDSLRDATRTMNRERALRRQLAELMMPDAPPITGSQMLRLRSIISGQEEYLAQLDKACAYLSQEANVERAPSEAVRVLLTGVPVVHGVEWIVEAMERAGGLVVCTENCTGLKPLLEDVDETVTDPFDALAAKYYHLPCSVMSRNTRRLFALRDLVEEFRAECVIDLVWQDCITYDVESYNVKRFCEQELGVPYLKVGADYSPSSAPRLQTRFQALYEIVRERRK